MRKFLTSALVALTIGGAVAAPAAAQSYYGNDRHYRSHRSGSDTAAVAAFAGIAGLALGAALSSNNNGYRSRSGYSPSYGSGYDSGSGYSSGYGSSYYGNGYTYDPRYDGYSGNYYGRGDAYGGGYYDRNRVCSSRERVYDPYTGRRVIIERQYAC